MQKLADEVFSSNTTLFRIEKTGVVTDKELAKQIAKFLDIGFEDMYEKIDESEECIDEWKEQVKKLFARMPDVGLSYFIFFVKVYEQGKSYTSFTPTYWKDFSDTEGMKIRNISLYEPTADAIGIGKDQYSKIENGKVTCTIDNLFLLAQYLDLDVQFLLFGKSENCEVKDDAKRSLDALDEECILQPQSVTKGRRPPIPILTMPMGMYSGRLPARPPN